MAKPKEWKRCVSIPWLRSNGGPDGGGNRFSGEGPWENRAEASPAQLSFYGEMPKVTSDTYLKICQNHEPLSAVVVRNQEGAGGLNKGVSPVLSNQSIVPAWKRSVFNGLAQVLVQAGKTAGGIRLTARAEGLAGMMVVIRGVGHPMRASLP